MRIDICGLLQVYGWHRTRLAAVLKPDGPSREEFWGILFAVRVGIEVRSWKWKIFDGDRDEFVQMESELK